MTIFLRILQGIVLIACFAFAIAGLFISVTSWKGLSIPLWMGWGCALLLFTCNAGLTWAWFRLRVRQLEQFRQGDIELLDDSVKVPHKLPAKNKIRLWYKRPVSAK